MRSNVQVTLQILKALMEKSPRDLPLYAHSILQILITVLRSKDLTMVEESIPTFETFCAHHDMATLAADQEHNRRYLEVVGIYAGFASSAPPVQTKGPISVPVAIRWRSVGLQAIKSATSSEALSSDDGKQLDFIVPAILRNLYSANGARLRTLHQRAQVSEAADTEQAVRRRMSISTVRTFEEHDTHPITLTATADDADKLAEEEVGILALQSLRQIFVVNNRAQIRLATTCFLTFVLNKTTLQTHDIGLDSRSRGTGGWSTTLMEMIARWTPVQDRFVILVTTMETLVRSPITEDNLEKQLMLATLVSWLLSSTVNLIGLSVMDVLLGLIQHILLLLQLGGSGSDVSPHHQQIIEVDPLQDGKEKFDQPSSTDSIEKTAVPTVYTASHLRQELLLRLQKCIGDLATHIYYSDQISDMIEAIFLRLKPSPMSGITTAAAAIEHPAAAAQAISKSVKLQEDPNTDDFFSFDTARITALKAIKDVLMIANSHGAVQGTGAIVRNKVSVQVWEGTQWLLRDIDRGVRRAYVDALLTWLRLEMSTDDLRVLEDRRTFSKKTAKKEVLMDSESVKRATSSASQREKLSNPPRSTFLQLLHLAIYDNAIESPESESEISLLHLLLTTSIEKLGVNAVKYGLPMIFRLQEDINNDLIIATPLAKVNVGSLVHGYFWALTEEFDLDTSKVGYEIHSEITRRKRKGLWLGEIRLPPLPLDQIDTSGTVPIAEKLPLPTLEQESLKPFDTRPALVELIAAAYATRMASSPPSAPSSPGRVASISTYNRSNNTEENIASEHQLPSEFKAAMFADWTKEACIASVEKERAKAVSVNGSRTGTTPSAARNFLAVNGYARNNSPKGNSHHNHHANGSRPPSAAYGLVGGLGEIQKFRRASAQDSSPTRISTSSRTSTVRVEELKRVLAGERIASRTASPLRFRPHSPNSITSSSSDASGSLSSGDLYASDTPSYTRRTNAAENIAAADFAERPQRRSASRQRQQPFVQTSSALTSTPTSTTTTMKLGSTIPTNNHKPPPSPPKTTSPLSPLDDPAVNAAALAGERITNLDPKAADDVPPVPPLPASLSLSASGPFTTDALPGTEAQTAKQTPAPAQTQRPATAPANSHGHAHGTGSAYSYTQGLPTSLEGFGAMGPGTGSRSAGKERQRHRHVSRGAPRDGSPAARFGVEHGRIDIEALLAGIKIPSSEQPSAFGGREGASGGIGLGGEGGNGMERAEGREGMWAARRVTGIGKPPY